jgi:peptidylprolyl isomerase
MRFLATLFGVFIMATTAQAAPSDPENTLLLQLKDGAVVIALRPDLAPNHVARIKELTRKGFYDGIVFHRVIEGFMAQTGDPTGTGTGGSGQRIKAEFSDAHFVRGTLGMARSNNPNSADSQFFICFKPANFLDGEYTVFGQVVEGMEFVDKITRGEPPANPDKIVSLKVAADVEGAAAAPKAAAGQ